MNEHSEQWWWLSFADGSRPRGEQFLGVAVVQAQGIVSAARRAHQLGINPGGEVQGVPLPDGIVVPTDYRNRLLSYEDLQVAGFL